MTIKMNVLCIDAASVTCACCAVKDGKIISEEFINNGLNHSKTLLPAIKKVLELSETDIRDINLIAVTVGPGSFTGVKIAAATAKGLAFGADIPCVPVSTLEALAYNRSMNGLVCPVMDARRGMLYNALFMIKDGKAERITEDRQISREKLFEEINGKDIFVTGDGTELFIRFCAENGFIPAAAENDMRFVRGEGIYKATANGGFASVPNEKLVPKYLRPSQAERERLEKERKPGNES